MKSVFSLATLLIASCATASDTITAEPDGNSYNYVSQYTVEIDAPAKTVWSHLVDIPSWMYEFEMSLVSGTPNEEGEVRRLYEGQDFLTQITKTIPGDLLVISNLPTTFNGETSTGVAVVTLNEVNGITTVRVVMSRRYTWNGTGDNPQKTVRESQDFANRTKAMWEIRFLGRLRELAESQ
ncbi:MAG: hypothetical protein K0U72_01485 [Gammaproteobacteria bacterium]|nr:hypothetical protein [Gammaproteobacteria bacterium]